MGRPACVFRWILSVFCVAKPRMYFDVNRDGANARLYCYFWIAGQGRFGVDLGEQGFNHGDHFGGVGLVVDPIEERDALQTVSTNAGAGFDGGFFKAAKDGV